jgi:hypothetical protein
MLVGTRAGRSYTGAELGALLVSAGARDVRRLDLAGPAGSSVVAASVP